MTWTTLCDCSRRAATRLLLLLVASGIAACNALDVSDPTAFREAEVNNAEGAELLRRAALRSLYNVADDEAWFSGVVADEFLSEVSPFTDPLTDEDNLLDRRESALYEELFTFNPRYQEWQGLRARLTRVAMEKLEAYALPGSREAHVGEMLAVRAFATLRMAEDFCPGFPLHDVVNFTIVYGSPLSTEQALEHALADFEAAVSKAADSARVLNFARVGRARTLLQLGRFAEAAGAAADVPDDYVYGAEYNSTFSPYQPNDLAYTSLFAGWGNWRSVADREGGTGLDFVSANDPRVHTVSLGTAADGTVLYGIAKYPTIGTPIVLASGVEARLIEAEAALQAGDVTTWLAKLNKLRQTAITPPLPDTTDPGTPDARVDLTFRERAFWLFATGTRLGDLRRLIRHYNRARESVFPTGSYRLGGTYGTGTSIPFGRGGGGTTPETPGCTTW